MNENFLRNKTNESILLSVLKIGLFDDTLRTDAL
jgi:hypothetical protein